MAWRSVLVAMVAWVGMALAGCGIAVAGGAGGAGGGKQGRMMLVAEPGVRNLLEYGGHGVLVYDMDHGNRFVKRIPAGGGLDKDGKPDNVKGICASAATNRLYVSTIGGLQCYDLTSEAMLWEKKYDKGCDRMSIAADGKIIYCPAFEGTVWYVLDALTGDEIKRITGPDGSHNTVMGNADVYFAGLRSRTLAITDLVKKETVKTVGPFGNSIRPYVVNGRETLVYANVNDLLGFEIGDLKTGKVVARVEVTGFEKGAVKRHGCPSHGIALTQDEKEVWVCDSHNRRIHIFDNTVMPPKYVQSLEMNDEPAWITISIDGKWAYPSTGEVIDVKTKKTIAMLKDENGKPIQSEKMVEVDFAGGKAVKAGDQFALGKVE